MMSSTSTLTESVCDLCGANHATTCCSVFQEANTVPNSTTPTFARLSLPKDLELVTMADGSETVRTKKKLAINSMFGPFNAPSTRLLPPLVTFPLKVFVPSEGDDKPTGFYYLDTSDEVTSNWMRFVQGSVTGFQKSREQNLMCHQFERNIYYMTSREIMEGEELKVGYAPSYAKKMGLPATIGPKQGKTAREVLAWMRREAKAAATRTADCLPAATLGVPAVKARAAWRCNVCDRADFGSVAQYAAHLRLHYKAQKGAGGPAARRRSVRATNSQFDTLVTFMTLHEEFGRGRLTGATGKATQTALWALLTTLLNDDPTGPSKDAKSWGETWDNWKSKTRKKRAEKIKNEQTGSAHKEIRYTGEEQKLLDFLDSAGAPGDSGAPEGGGLLAAYIESSHLAAEESEGSVIVDGVSFLLEDHTGYLEEVDISVSEPPSPAGSRAATPVPLPGKGRKRKSPAKSIDAKGRKKKKKPATVSEPLEAVGDGDDRQGDVFGEIATALTSIAASFVRIASALENHT